MAAKGGYRQETIQRMYTTVHGGVLVRRLCATSDMCALSYV